MIKTFEELQKRLRVIELCYDNSDLLKLWAYTGYQMSQIQENRAEIAALKKWQAKMITFVTQEFHKVKDLEKRMLDIDGDQPIGHA